MKLREKTLIILDNLKKEGFHPVDVEFLNGYTIFEYGEDTVVHFRIKECKGWKFGIWWDSEPEKESEEKDEGKFTDEGRFTFFAQFEEMIDKFKPSASTLVIDDRQFYKEDRYLYRQLSEFCRFIQKHPLKARYADEEYLNTIWEPMPSEFWLFWKYWYEDSRKKFVQKVLKERINKRYLKLLEQVCEETLEDYKIIDNNQGDWVCYPRWDVVAKNFKVNAVKERGNYAWDFEGLSRKTRKKVKKFDKRLDQLQRRFTDFWLRSEFWDIESFESSTVIIKVNSKKDAGKKGKEDDKR